MLNLHYTIQNSHHNQSYYQIFNNVQHNSWHSTSYFFMLLVWRGMLGMLYASMVWEPNEVDLWENGLMYVLSHGVNDLHLGRIGFLKTSQ